MPLLGLRSVISFLLRVVSKAKNVFQNSAQSRSNIDIQTYIFELLIRFSITPNWKLNKSLDRLHIIELIKWTFFWYPVCFSAL